MPNLVEIGPRVVLDKKIENVVNVIMLFCYNLCLEKGVVLHLNKFKSPLQKDAFWEVWLKFAE